MTPRDLAPTFANTGVLTHHALGCRCWPHVSEQCALDAIAASALAEYRDGKNRPPAPPPDALRAEPNDWVRLAEMLDGYDNFGASLPGVVPTRKNRNLAQFLLASGLGFAATPAPLALDVERLAEEGQWSPYFRSLPVEEQLRLMVSSRDAAYSQRTDWMHRAEAAETALAAISQAEPRPEPRP